GIPGTGIYYQDMSAWPTPKIGPSQAPTQPPPAPPKITPAHPAPAGGILPPPVQLSAAAAPPALPGTASTQVRTVSQVILVVVVAVLIGIAVRPSAPPPVKTAPVAAPSSVTGTAASPPKVSPLVPSVAQISPDRPLSPTEVRVLQITLNRIGVDVG